MRKRHLLLLVYACFGDGAFALERPNQGELLAKTDVLGRINTDISQICARSFLEPKCRSFQDRFSDNLNVKNFGAKLDGSNDAPGFSLARSKAKLGQTITVPPGIFAPEGPINGGPDRVFWNIDGALYYPDGKTPLTNIGSDLTRSILYGSSEFLSRHDVASEQPPLLRIDRAFNYVGGLPGNVHSGSQINCNINGNGSQSPFEGYVWCLQSVVRANDMGPGQHVAINGTVLREHPPADIKSGTSTSPTWAGLFLNQDDTGKYLGNQVGIEVDVVGSGVDKEKRRIIVQAAIASHPPAGKPNEEFSVATGMTMGSNTPVGYFGVGYELTAKYDVAAFDASRALPINNAPALRLAEGQRIAWVADSALFTSAINGVVGTFAGTNRIFGIDTSGNTSQPGEMTAGSVRETKSLTPPTSRAPCVRGSRAWDANYEYRCVATNRWRRIAYMPDW